DCVTAISLPGDAGAGPQIDTRTRANTPRRDIYLLMSPGNAIALAAHQRIALRQREIGYHHLPHQLLEVGARHPAQLRARLSRIAQQRVDFRWAKVARVDAHHDAAALAVDAHLFAPAAAPADAHVEMGGRLLHELAHRMLAPGGNHVILWMAALQHQPLRLHVVTRMAPVAARLEIAEVQTALQPDMDAGQPTGDLARYEGLAADG